MNKCESRRKLAIEILGRASTGVVMGRGDLVRGLRKSLGEGASEELDHLVEQGALRVISVSGHYQITESGKTLEAGLQILQDELAEAQADANNGMPANMGELIAHMNRLEQWAIEETERDLTGDRPLNLEMVGVLSHAVHDLEWLR